MTKSEKKEPRQVAVPGSIWVLLGFLLWIGFFIGAVILHAAGR